MKVGQIGFVCEMGPVGLACEMDPLGPHGSGKWCGEGSCLFRRDWAGNSSSMS